MSTPACKCKCSRRERSSDEKKKTAEKDSDAKCENGVGLGKHRTTESRHEGKIGEKTTKRRRDEVRIN
jgi:hypothetical protein